MMRQTVRTGTFGIVLIPEKITRMDVEGETTYHYVSHEAMRLHLIFKVIKKVHIIEAMTPLVPGIGYDMV